MTKDEYVDPFHENNMPGPGVTTRSTGLQPWEVDTSMKKTLRDEFAMAALMNAEAIASVMPKDPVLAADELASLAYRIADAMLEARKQKDCDSVKE